MVSLSHNLNFIVYTQKITLITCLWPVVLTMYNIYFYFQICINNNIIGVEHTKPEMGIAFLHKPTA